MNYKRLTSNNDGTFAVKEFDDFMDMSFPTFGEFGDIDRKLYGKKASHVMKTDVHEHDDHFEADIDLPGFKKEQIKLHLEDGYLTVSAEKGLDKATGRVLVEVDPKYFRPAEVDQLLGDPTKAKRQLGWNPRKTSFEELVRIMVDYDMQHIKKIHHLK